MIVPTYETTAKEQEMIINELRSINRTQENRINIQKEEIERLNNIIKEAREQINKDREKNNYEKDGLMKQAFYCNKTDKLLEILDKENK